jgi:beta-1,4-N-acetylglucosaminyltransferase
MAPVHMRVFVTVGSTKFDSLVQTVLSEPVLAALRDRGYDNVTVQCGNMSSTKDWFPGTSYSINGSSIELFRFKPSLEDDYGAADLIISHAGAQRTDYNVRAPGLRRAGSGTILDVLRKAKPLIIVPNKSLADDHQTELANELGGLNYCKTFATSTFRFVARALAGLCIDASCSAFAQDIRNFDPASLAPFPAFDGSRFKNILDEEMGYEIG